MFLVIISSCIYNLELYWNFSFFLEFSMFHSSVLAYFTLISWNMLLLYPYSYLCCLNVQYTSVIVLSPECPYSKGARISGISGIFLSNLGLELAFPNYGFRAFPSIFTEKFQDTTSSRLWPFPSKWFLIQHSPTLDSIQPQILTARDINCRNITKMLYHFSGMVSVWFGSLVVKV
jgi:hypothetical protein